MALRQEHQPMAEKMRISNPDWNHRDRYWTPTDSIGTGKEYRMTNGGRRKVFQLIPPLQRRAFSAGGSTILVRIFQIADFRFCLMALKKSMNSSKDFPWRESCSSGINQMDEVCGFWLSWGQNPGQSVQIVLAGRSRLRGQSEKFPGLCAWQMKSIHIN